MKKKITPETTIAAFVIALAAVLATAALAQQKAVEQFKHYLEQRDVSDSTSAATEANRHADLRSLAHRIERLEQHHDRDDLRPPARALNTGTDVPC